MHSLKNMLKFTPYVSLICAKEDEKHSYLF